MPANGCYTLSAGANATSKLKTCFPALKVWDAVALNSIGREYE